MNLQEAFGLINEARKEGIVQQMTADPINTLKMFTTKGLMITGDDGITVLAKGADQKAFDDLKARLSAKTFRYNPADTTVTASGLSFTPTK